MAATDRQNRELQAKVAKQIASGKHKSPLELLRLKCLERGASGIKGLGRTFRIFDDDGNKMLDIKEFRKGLRDYGIDMEPEQIDEAFYEVDMNKDNTLHFDEFLRALRPPMSASRKKLVIAAFRKLDKTGDGVVTIEDLKGVYNAKNHPKYKSGEMTEEDVFKIFLKGFDDPGNPDGQVTEEEFMNYYFGVSCSIDNDSYFDLMMRQAWKI